MTGDVLPFPTTLVTGGHCPGWCELADHGHPYRFGLDDSDPPSYHRLHRLRLGDLANGQARLDLSQLETTADPAQPGHFATAEVVLSMSALMDGGLSLPSPAALSEFIAGLQTAAEQLHLAMTNTQRTAD